MGLLKTGRKTLFLRDGSNPFCSQQPLCILDFFVLPQAQRQGVGQALFEVTLFLHQRFRLMKDRLLVRHLLCYEVISLH